MATDVATMGVLHAIACSTLFRMPDLLSIGLGGGSHVVLEGAEGPLKVGPVSVGYRLLKDGVAFGGKQLTTTDIAVASGVLKLGDKHKVADFQTSRKNQGWDYFGRDGQRGHSPLKSVVHGDLSR